MKLADFSGDIVAKINDPLFVTARILGHFQDGNEFCATGFFFNLGEDRPDKSIRIILVTNKHVFDDAVDAGFTMHGCTPEFPKKPSGQAIFVPINLSKWIFPHPDPEVDLSALLIEPLLDNIGMQDQTIFCKAMGRVNVASDKELLELGPVEDVIMVGYPNGLWDEINNLPLIRKGVTATHPGIDYRGRPLGLVDMPCIQGSSGSPILTHPHDRIFYRDDLGASVKGMLLLGVYSHSYAVQKAVGASNFQVAGEEIHLHLGHYWKAREILVLVKLVKESIAKS